MTELRRRRRAAVALFAFSSLALLATTPGPPTARAEASGEVFVAPDEPDHLEVRFTVVDPAPDEITRVAVNRLIGSGPDDRLDVSVSAAIGDGGRSQSGAAYRIELDPAECVAGCEVVATIDAAWRGQPEAGLRVSWWVELEVEYGHRVPAAAISATVVSGGDAFPPRLVWLGMGALLAVAAAVGLRLTRPRLAALRLVLAAGLLAVAAWPLAMLGPYLERWLAARLIIGVETLALAGAGLALGTGVAVGIVRTAGGRPTVLRLVGWIAALVIGYAWWALAINLGTYRPHEMTAVTVALGVFAAAAITAVPLHAAGEPRPTVGLGTSLVMAIQVLLLGIVLLVAVASLVAFVVGTLGGAVPDLASLGGVLVAIAFAGLFMFGWLDWRRGSMRNILIVNSVAVVAALGLGTVVLLQGDSSLFSVGIELRVLAVLVMVTVLVGAIGLRVVDPPLAEDERDGEDGQGDEVPRVADEEDPIRLGDGA